MFPYEILLGLRGSMRTCAHGFIGRQNSLQKLNVEVQHFYNSAILTRNKYSLRLSYRDVNINSIRRFHTQLLVNLQATPKDSKPAETNKMPEQDEDPLNDMVESVSNSYKKRDNRNSISESAKKWLTTETDKIPSRDIEKLFPEPKTFLNNLYSIVKNETNNPHCLTSTSKLVNHHKGKHSWSHTFNIMWPEIKSFTAVSHSKTAASHSASLKVLYWLKLNDRIRNRQPVVYDRKESMSVINAPIEITLNKDVLNEVDDFLNKYEESVLEFMEGVEETNNFESAEMNSGKHHPISHFKVNIDSRNEQLKKRYETLKNISKPDLPIFLYKNQILKELEENQALVIKGDTGCGKTTQVPQFIMDHFAESGFGAECKMIVTQPRRISAISLAERIAFERQEDIGDVLGYQVRLNQKLPKQNGGILFCTTGLLIKKMQGNPSLENCSHVIVDEAHERSIETDMLLVLLKRAMAKNPNLKIIIMSATINADLFQEFLGCNSVEVPGRLFPVEMNFLEDIDKLGITNGPENPEVSKDDEFDGPFVNHDHITNLINWISHNKPPGAILCFLPGWNDILKIQNNLEYIGNRNQLVIPLHSKLPHATQHQIFSPAPKNVRKIILATDIAETGITVPDVVYVIDSACHKQVRWHESRGLSSIKTHWVSQANINQRKGRAGRVQKGESFHFITRDKYETLDEYPLPEVHRVSLEKTVLLAKTYSNEKAGDFFSSMPQPPRSSAVETAVFDLQVLGALNSDEDLTPLGKRIALFTIHPKLSKALVYGSIFQCLGPVTTAVTNLSQDSEIFYGTLNDKVRIRKMKSKFHPSSDHLAVSWIYSQWYDYLQQSPTIAYNYCKGNRLVVDKVKVLHKSRDINLESLRDTGLIQDLQRVSNMRSEENEYALLDELVRGVLLAGFDQILKHRDFEIRKGRFSKSGTSMVTEDDSRAQLSTESVNYKRKSWPSPYLTYYQKTHHEERRTTLIRESSMVSPLTVLLFSQGQISGTSIVDPNTEEEKVLLKIVGKDNVQLFCDVSTAESILRFRDIMWTVVRFYVENNVYNRSLYNDGSNPTSISLYREQLLKILAKILVSSSKSIDSTTDSDSVSSLYDEDDGLYR